MCVCVCSFVQNSSQSSLTDAFEELDGTDSGLLLQPQPTKVHRGGTHTLTHYIFCILIILLDYAANRLDSYVLKICSIVSICIVFESSVCLFIASISNGSPSTLRNPHRAEEESLTEEYTGKHVHFIQIHNIQLVPGLDIYVKVGVCVGSWWMWSVTDGARSLLIQREATNLNTLLLIYLML